ncbi:hypothetical protein AS593_12005 [Caulobacter vibrioides]|nr:hypothetical protein AS593_12005 [Caulobacter vibrioides]
MDFPSIADWSKYGIGATACLGLAALLFSVLGNTLPNPLKAKKEEFQFFVLIAVLFLASVAGAAFFVEGKRQVDLKPLKAAQEMVKGRWYIVHSDGSGSCADAQDFVLEDDLILVVSRDDKFPYVHDTKLLGGGVLYAVEKTTGVRSIYYKDGDVLMEKMASEGVVRRRKCP